MDYINEIGQKYLNFGDTFVYDVDGIRGFIKAEYLIDGSVHLSGLRVSSRHRRHGIASALTMHAVDHAKDSGCVSSRILVDVTNRASQQLSEGLGFRIIGRYCFYGGLIDTAGFEPVLYSQKFSNIGWKFVRLDKIRGELMVLGKGGSRLTEFLDNESSTNVRHFTILERGEFSVVAGNGIITVPSDMKDLVPDHVSTFSGFEEAFLLEKPLV